MLHFSPSVASTFFNTIFFKGNFSFRKTQSYRESILDSRESRQTWIIWGFVKISCMRCNEWTIKISNKTKCIYCKCISYIKAAQPDMIFKIVDYFPYIYIYIFLKSEWFSKRSLFESSHNSITRVILVEKWKLVNNNIQCFLISKNRVNSLLLFSFSKLKKFIF